MPEKMRSVQIILGAPLDSILASRAADSPGDSVAVARYHEEDRSPVLAFLPDSTMSATFDSQRLRRHVDEFLARRELYKSFTTFLETEFRRALKSLGIESDVK